MTEDEMHGITDLMGVSLNKIREFVLDREVWSAACGKRVSPSWVTGRTH